VLTLSGFVGLATMSASVALPLWLAATAFRDAQPLMIYTAVVAGCIIYWHRANIQRMLAGNENRNEKMMLFRGRRSAGRDERA
jgi:glycerol-3-phosphate acyltransferase PlsY